ncbi:MAG: proton-conducting transporter membrane subunit [Fidelibacterota bacterium]
MADYTLLLIALPVIVGIVNIFLPVILRKILNSALLIYLLYPVYLLFQTTGWNYEFMNTTIFAVDRLSLMTLVSIQVISLIIFIFLLKSLDKAYEKIFMVFYPMTIGVCNAAVMSVNSWALLIAWGLSGIFLFLFGLVGKQKGNSESAVKTFLLVGGSDVLLILGLVLLRYLEYSNGWQLWNLQLPVVGELARVAFICLMIASFAKAGVFPFHTWMPDYSKNTLTEAVAFLPAALDKLLGIYLLARLVISVFVLNTTINLVLMSIGAFTIIAAVMMALIQHNGKKLLGYHAVSQVGYMVLGIGSGNVLAFAGGIFHLINNVLYKTGLFLSIGSVEKRTGTADLDEMGGLGNKMFLTFLPALVASLSISGIPPFNGFFSKWMIYQGILDFAKDLTPGLQVWALVCLILAVFGSALTLASFLKFLHTIFLGKPREKYKDIKEAPANQWIATMIIALFCIGLGLFAVKIPLESLIYPAMNDMGMATPDWFGSYNPLLIFGLILLVFIPGLIFFLLIKNVRYDEIYLGGMKAIEKFRVSGTGWYNEVRNMRPLKGIYTAAEMKIFDLYSWLKNIAKGLGKLLSLLHLGQLQFYNLWIIIGVMVLFWMIK